MVKGAFTLVGTATVLCAALLILNTMGFISVVESPANASRDIFYVSEPVVQETPPSPVPPPPAATATRVNGATLPPSVEGVLQSGVLIVISTASQQMYVFKDGVLWDNSPVSTGKRGKETPPGIFPILQKRVHHRSNIYSNAPMPHMQRLTWGGIAIHAGQLPGYPASHGCIRVPKDFARALFQLTKPETTTVVVSDQPFDTDRMARVAALNMPAPLPGERGHLVQRPEPSLPQIDELTEPQPRFARAEPTAEPQPEASRPAIAAASPAVSPRPVNLLDQAKPAPRGQTIQLAARGSANEAEAYWSRISDRYPELERYHKSIEPAVVRSRQYYRLRVTGPGANAMCSSLKASGTDCFPVK